MKEWGHKMLPVYMEISKEAKRIINNNIGIIFRVLLDMCEDLSYEELLSDIYPKFLINENFNKCKQTILELYEMCLDEYNRDYLLPFYEYSLFHTINWWLEVNDVVEFDEIPKEYSISLDGIDLYTYLNDEQNYLDFLFEDWDFDDVPMLFNI